MAQGTAQAKDAGTASWSSPVRRWEGTGKGSVHRKWRTDSRRAAINDSAAYIEAGNALCRAIRESSTWPFALDKAGAVRKIRKLYSHLAKLREGEAQALVKLGIEYNAAFTKASQKVAAFDPNS